MNTENYQPDTSWLHGKYSVLNAEINTSIPYVAIEEYFWQGEEANNVINEIHAIWLQGGFIEEAIQKYASLYL
jgi:hypothetical protein